MEIRQHPTVQQFYAIHPQGETRQVASIDSEMLRNICLEAGADDVGFVGVDDPAVAPQRADIDWLMPGTQALISFVCRMNQENIRTPARSVSNLEFHIQTDETNVVAQKIVSRLEALKIRASIAGAAGFPMESDRFGGKPWTISHKPIAVAAGLGQMGIHRNVIHPKFGNFVLLGTVLVSAKVTRYTTAIEYNPCLECKLCVAACPTGAIHPDGHFDFSACYTHNYREFMGGFGDWVENIASSRSALDYRKKVSNAETQSMWQSLSYGANYKAAYCMAVCPAGEDVIGPFLTDRKAFLDNIVKPLQQKQETVYVAANSDAEAFVARRYPHKKTKRVRNGLAGQVSVKNFLFGMPLAFQRGKSKGLNAVYHFAFTGDENCDATVVIRDETLRVLDGHVGAPNLVVTADSQVWLRFLRKETSIVRALLTRKIKLRGSPKLLLAFGRCFPS